MSIRATLLRTTIAPIVAAVVGGVGVVLWAQTQTSDTRSPFLPNNPALIVVADPKGFTPCGECHTQEWEVWKGTKHAMSFDSLNKKSMAPQYLENMGVRSSKRDGAPCLRCHYTEGPNHSAVAGVSCESCHGAARNWVDVHRTWADGAKDKASESAAGKAKRIASSRAAGMLRPSSDVYGVAANCFECHTVPFEDLVNRGQHKAGSAGFELVKRVNLIRHNLLGAGKTGGTNRPDTPERTRVLFVVGRMLDYEYSLRGLAVATIDTGTYFRQMRTREKASRSKLEEIATATSIPAVSEVLKIASKIKIAVNNGAELKAAAEQIRGIGQTFASSVTGTTLAAIDPLVAGKAVVVAEAEAPATAETAAPTKPVTGAVNAATPPATSAPPGTAAGAAAGAAATVTTTSAPAAGAAQLPGQIRNRTSWYTAAGKSGMADEGECAGCHAEAESKMSDSKHQQASQRLKGENAKARQIAELYGIGAAGMARPDKICMSCHATIDEANKSVHEEGVTCERCHGAGASYLDAHKKGGNPQKGMRALKQAADRAQLCSECHRISDERLLAAGHPSGEKYDIAAGSEKIKHWPGAKPEKGRKARGETYTGPADAALKAAFASIASARPIPNVTVVAPPAGAAPARRVAAATPPDVTAGSSSTPPSTTAASTASTSTGTSPAQVRGPVESSMPPRVPTTLQPRASTATVTIELEPLPAVGQLTTEELMLLVKKRIASIHAALRRGN